MPNASRGSLRAVLEPGQWVTLCRLEDPYRDPAYAFHYLTAHLEADERNAANVTVAMHESEDGEHWIQLGVFQTIVPGGQLELTENHVLKWVRIMLHSVSHGVVSATKITTEDQTLPGFVLAHVDIEVAEPAVTVGFGGLPIQCQFSYDFEAQLDWEPVEWCLEGNEPTIAMVVIGGGGGGPNCFTLYPNLDLYVRDANAGEVVYQGNPAGTSLSLNHDAYPGCAAGPAPPEIISGSFTVPDIFYVWYNQQGKCAPEVEPTLKQITITNTGTCVLRVNGTLVTAGQVFTVTDFDYAGYGTGDMSEWLGGTPVAL